MYYNISIRLIYIYWNVYFKFVSNRTKSLIKKILGDTRIWTMDLSDCSRLLYHWAISPSHATSSTVWVTCVDTGWRNVCYEGPLVAFADVQNMPWPGFEPGLLRPQRRVLTTRRSRQLTLGCPHRAFDWQKSAPPQRPRNWLTVSAWPAANC